MHKADSLVAFSCAPGALVDDRSEEQNSLFMKHLLKHLATPNEDIANVLRDVTNGMMQDSNSTQIPFINVQLRHKNIYLCEQADGKNSSFRWSETRVTTKVVSSTQCMNIQ
ncbi:unnamed protein product [Rotaria magnacalcarata]|nr:unnamed protein product [Rotaria magnacalcarata]